MLSLISLIRSICQLLWKWKGFPYLSLLVWVLPLLLFNSEQQSLMAHDEGLYALRSRRMIDSNDWIHPWEKPHHKTPGYYWLVAIAFRLFGVSEVSARFPSIVLGILSTLLLYEIGRILLNKKIAWLAGAILSIEFLWLQYSRLGTPDISYIFLVLLAIFSLLQAEKTSKFSYIWGLVFGLCLSLGFLIRSFMIFVPFSALLPYLVVEHHRHNHLKNPMIYLGIIIGFIPTLFWVYLSWLNYGEESWQALVEFPARLASSERDHNGIFYYFWNVPLKSLPWSLFAFFGLYLAIKNPIKNYQLILIGIPLIIFGEITLFSTRLSHYGLPLYPFIALLAALGLGKLVDIYNFNQDKITRINLSSLFAFHFLDIQNHQIKTLPQNLSYIFGILGGILLFCSAYVLFLGDKDIRKYVTLTLILGSGWLTLPLVWIGRCYYGKSLFTANCWLSAWLIPVWLTLAVAGSNGLLGDYNTDFKNFIEQPTIAKILENNSVNFLQIGGKTGVLINFYTPNPGDKLTKAAELADYSYAWIEAKNVTYLSKNYHSLGSIKNYKIIQVLPK